MNTNDKRPISSLDLPAMQHHPVWEYVDSSGDREVFVRPSTTIPTPDTKNKVIATQVRLACGRLVWCLLGNIDPRPKYTEHFITISVERNGHWFHLARYHDVDYSARSPERLASFLELSVDEVFPIRYDIRQFAIGEPAVMHGSIPREPNEKLSRADIIALAVS